jgi:DNA repair protein RecN (Recombination protein N)
MITELRIADLGVINDATLSLHPGLTVVTGETGAGKTMIVTGLGLLLGGRADPRSVRRGSQRARVEGRFKIEDAELVRRVSEAGGELDDDELIVARHVTTAGRSRAYVGGAQLPASFCAELTATLVHIHGPSHRGRPATAAPGSFRWRGSAGTSRSVLRSLGRGSRRPGGVGTPPRRGSEPRP